MNILLTGGSGFIGRNVIKVLLAENHHVIAFNRSKITHFSDKKNFQWMQGNLATGEGLEKLPWEKLDCVIHLAAAGVKASQREWAECIQVNIIGTEQLLRFLSKRAVKFPKIFVTKTFYEKSIQTVPAFRNNPYIATKAASSQLAELWSEDYKGVTIFGTLYHSFGPDDDISSVLSYAAGQLKAERPATFSSGKALGDWLYISDTVAGILTAIKESQHSINHWDIGSGNLTTVRDLVEQLQQISGKSGGNIVFDPMLDRTDITLHEAAQKLPSGFLPKFSLQQGLEEHYRLI